MGGHRTSASSSSSSSSSSESSGGHRQREEKGMDKLDYTGLNYTFVPAPAGFIHSSGKKHHRHRYHSCASPPSPSHHRRHSFEHPSAEGSHHFSFHPPMGCPQHQQFTGHPHHHRLPPPIGFPGQHHHYKEGKLRVKPPKHLKKVHKLHRKLMKAYKLPKSAGHGAHRLYHVEFPPPKKGFFSAPFGYNHPPGCCGRRHSMEEMEGPSRLDEMGILHHERPQCEGRCPHPACRKGSLIKSEVAGGDAAIVSPRGMKAPAKALVEGAPMALASDVPPADKPGPVVLAP